MNKQFIPYELALKLRKLGFDDYVFAFYWIDTKQLILDSPNYLGKHHGVHLQATTWQQAFDWILDNYKLYAIPIPTVTMNWTFKTMSVVEGEVEVTPYTYVEAEDYSSYEQARLESLKELIRLIEGK